MFGTPTRKTNKDGQTVFHLDVNTTPLGVELEYNTSGLLYTKDAQSRFRTLQNLVLSELAKEKHLFKNPPTLASLTTICPNWGFVSSGASYIFSPYATLLSDIPASKLPCVVDIQLKSLEISRSTIAPQFKLHYLGTRPPEIDIDWVDPGLPTSGDEIVEVSDVPSNTGGPMLTLADPAKQAREKAEAKARVRAAFVAAQEARTTAESLAQTFYEAYDLSDSESAFTEWLSDSDDEDSE